MAFQQDKQNKVTKTIFIAIFVGIILFVALLLLQATQLSHSTGTRLVGLGPLHMMELQKNPIEGGFSVSLQILSGLFVYAMVLVIIGAALGYWRSRSQNKPKRSSGL